MPILIAHRGGPEVYPEQTVQSCRDALSAGADMAEMDIRSSRVDTQLNTERFARIVGLLEFLFEFFLRDDFDNAAHQNIKLFFNRTKLHSFLSG